MVIYTQQNDALDSLCNAITFLRTTVIMKNAILDFVSWDGTHFYRV